MGTELQFQKKTLFKCFPRTQPKSRFGGCGAAGNSQHELWVLGCRMEEVLFHISHLWAPMVKRQQWFSLWQPSGTDLRCCGAHIFYLHVCVDSFQFALFLVLWLLLYSLAFCSEGGEVCGKVHLGEKGTLLLRPEVRKPPISLLWDWLSYCSSWGLALWQEEVSDNLFH